MPEKEVKQKPVSDEEWEKWTRDARNHICDPNSKAKFGSLKEDLLTNEETVTELVRILDNISYGGFGDQSIVVRRDKKYQYPIKKIIETGVIELEVGAGQRLIPVTNPAYTFAWGHSAYYIQWPDGTPGFEPGRKGNTIVSLNLKDLSRIKPDKVIK